MLPYRYQPLRHDDSVRLLVLKPSPNLTDPVHITIHHARLRDHPEYEGLSYTWGDDSEKHAIYVNGNSRELFVRKNCHNALRRLRLADGDRVLWIDAICINQEDLPERSRQVRIMNQVFDDASHVVVFLGEQTRDFQALFAEFKAEEEQIELWDRFDQPWQRSRASQAIAQELEAFFELPWFKRVWVLQEVYGHSDFTFLYGPDSVSFTALENLYFGSSGPGEGNTRITDYLWPRALDFITHGVRTQSTTEMNLWCRLYDTRLCLATDARDRIFALKSILGSGKSDIDFMIDYTQSVERCFLQVANFLLPVLGPRILTAIRHPHSMRMSSWIPDWTQNLPLDYISFFGYLDTIPVSSQHWSRGNSEQLIVRGCRYAKIVECSQTFHFESIGVAKVQIQRLYYTLAKHRKLDIESIEDDSSMVGHLGQSILDVLVCIEDENLHNYLTRCHGFAISFTDDWRRACKEDIEQLYLALQGCRISLMDNGHLVIVPGAIQNGDVICIVSGTIWPCALRPSYDKSWIVISGDCFILTEGFTWDEITLPDEGGRFLTSELYIESNSHKLEEFVLR